MCFSTPYSQSGLDRYNLCAHSSLCALSFYNSKLTVTESNGAGTAFIWE
uniref:Uncharacterized protein n=1 Tax=Parascaris univalens TaxID=6257 RepID=A0A915ABJ6_PARUN